MSNVWSTLFGTFGTRADSSIGFVHGWKWAGPSSALPNTFRLTISPHDWSLLPGAWRLPGQDFQLPEQCVFQDAPCRRL